MKPPHPGIRDISELVREWEPFRLRQLVVHAAGNPGVTHRIDRDQFVAWHRMSAIVLSCPTLTDGRAVWCEGMAYEWEPCLAFSEWYFLQRLKSWKVPLLLPEW